MLEKNGFKYVGSVIVPKDILPELVFDIQIPPEDLIIEKAESSSPTQTMPSSQSPIPTIPKNEKREEVAQKTPGFGIIETFASLSAALYAIDKLWKERYRRKG